MKSKLLRLILLPLAAISLPACAQVQSFDFSGGFPAGSESLLRMASTQGAPYTGYPGPVVTGGLLRLTGSHLAASGAATYSSLVWLDGFSSTFDFQCTNPPGNPGELADGFTFCIRGENASLNSGEWGGGLGYSGIANSAAVKFDLWGGNEGHAGSVRTTGLFVNGEYPQGGSILPVDIGNGHRFRVFVQYRKNTTPTPQLSVQLVDLSTGASTKNVYAVDLAQLLGSEKGFIGFTVGTGGGWGQQDIWNWTYRRGEPNVEITATFNGTPMPAEILPSVYRLSNDSGYATPTKLQRVKVKVKSPSNASKPIRIWLESELGSGGHNHGPTVRPSGYFGTVAQINALVSAHPQNTKVFIGGAFNPSTPNADNLAEYAIPYTTQQRTVAAGLPTNSYANGVTLVLNSSGEGFFDYIAPEIAGSERIVVSTVSASPVQRDRSDMRIVFRYPGLITVPASDFLAWVAANAPGHQEGGVQGNYFATPNGKSALETLARQFKFDTGNKLPLNDCALKWGGMFDDNEKFVYPTHYGHRDGAEFDISTVFPNPALERILKEHPYWAITPALWASENVGSSQHYHVRLLGTASWRNGPSVQLAPGYPKFGAWNAAAKSRTVKIKFANRGPLRATVSVTGAQATNGATVSWHGSVSFAADATKLSPEYQFEVSNIVGWTTIVDLSGSGTDVSGTRPLQQYVNQQVVNGINFLIPGPP